MLCDGIELAVIVSYVVRQGYSGNLCTLCNYIVRIAKNNFNRILWGIDWAYKIEYPDGILAIKRNGILRYIITKNPKIRRDETVSKYMDIIKQGYEITAVMENIYNEFHQTLMGKQASRLGVFITKYESSVFKDFIKSIKEDIIPVTNAITSDISSGFVEGNNNKFKLIKRILYGRADLHTLFKKSYLAFKFGLNSFNLS